MKEDEKVSWWTTLPGVLTAIAGLITAVCALIASLQGIGLFGGAKDTNKPEIKSESAPPPPTTSLNQPLKLPPESQPDLAAEVPGTYRGAIHVLVLRMDGSRAVSNLLVTMTINSPVKQGHFKGSLVIATQDGTARNALEGTISGDRVTWGSNEMLFIGQYNGNIISGDITMKTDAFSNMDNGIRSVQGMKMDVSRN